MSWLEEIYICGCVGVGAGVVGRDFVSQLEVEIYVGPCRCGGCGEEMAEDINGREVLQGAQVKGRLFHHTLSTWSPG